MKQIIIASLVVATLFLLTSISQGATPQSGRNQPPKEEREKKAREGKRQQDCIDKKVKCGAPKPEYDDDPLPKRKDRRPIRIIVYNFTRARQPFGSSLLILINSS